MIYSLFKARLDWSESQIHITMWPFFPMGNWGYKPIYELIIGSGPSCISPMTSRALISCVAGQPLLCPRLTSPTDSWRQRWVRNDDWNLEEKH